MREWLNRRIESLLDNIIFSLLLAGAVVVVGLIKSLPLPIIIGIGLFVFALLLIAIRVTVNLSKKDRDYTKEWEHFSKLTDLILSLKTATKNNRLEIRNDIEGERNAIHDNEINRIMSLYLDVVDWEIQFTLGKHHDEEMRFAIELMRNHMNKKYKR